MVTTKLRLRDWDQLYQRAAKLEDVGPAITSALSSHVPRIASTVWTDSTILKYARTRQDRMALAGARVRSSARSTTLSGATRSGLGDKWYAVEFGDGQDTYETYRTRSPRGKSYTVRRRTQHQLPARVRRGRVLYRYGSEATRRILSAYAQTIVRTIHERLDGKV